MVKKKSKNRDARTGNVLLSELGEEYATVRVPKQRALEQMRLEGPGDTRRRELQGANAAGGEWRTG